MAAPDRLAPFVAQACNASQSAAEAAYFARFAREKHKNPADVYKRQAKGRVAYLEKTP